MSRVFKSAYLEVHTDDATVTARLHGRYVSQVLHNGVEATGTRCQTFPLNAQTVLVEYMRRCRREKRKHPDYTPNAIEDAALLRWVKELAEPRWFKRLWR